MYEQSNNNNHPYHIPLRHHVQEEAHCNLFPAKLFFFFFCFSFFFLCSNLPQIKPLSPLKSSDRRRTADQIIADFGIEVPVDPNAAPEDKAAATAGLTALRKSLLPENALSARFTTTAGPDLKQVSGTVYVGSHEGRNDGQRILWVKVGEKIHPTGLYPSANGKAHTLLTSQCTLSGIILG